MCPWLLHSSTNTRWCFGRFRQFPFPWVQFEANLITRRAKLSRQWCMVQFHEYVTYAKCFVSLFMIYPCASLFLPSPALVLVILLKDNFEKLLPLKFQFLLCCCASLLLLLQDVITNGFIFL